MRKVDGNWVGRIADTNNGNVFVELKQDEANPYGFARINEPVFGAALYNFVGVLENELC